MNIIGHALGEVDGRAKVTGHEVRVMIPCCRERSTASSCARPAPYAPIVRFSACRAHSARPGVLLVLTGSIFPSRMASSRSARTSTRLPWNRARFVGDPVAAAIARDELTAFEALELIDVR